MGVIQGHRILSVSEILHVNAEVSVYEEQRCPKETMFSAISCCFPDFVKLFYNTFCLKILKMFIVCHMKSGWY